MKEILRRIYNNHLVDNVTKFDHNKYYYFIEENNNIFGISKNNITENELNLITSNYRLLDEDDTQSNELLDFLFNKGPIVAYEKLKYYFIKFPGLINNEIKSDIDSLLRESFSDSILLTKRLGITIIIAEESIPFKEIIQSIESDFLINICGFESDLYKVDKLLPLYFQMDFNNFRLFKVRNQMLINKVNLFMSGLVSQLEDNSKRIIKQYVLKDYVNDNEMLNVIKMYFESNFNTTLTAKNCYMHRNTLLNKLDKFMITTNFNLRNYDEAFLVYLSIIM